MGRSHACPTTRSCGPPAGLTGRGDPGDSADVSREQVRLYTGTKSRSHPEYYALWDGKRATDHRECGARACLRRAFNLHVKFVRTMFDIYTSR